MSGQRKCSICGVVKFDEAFEFTNSRKTSRRTQCMECRNRGLTSANAISQSRIVEVEAALPKNPMERALAIRDHNSRALENSIQAIAVHGAEKFHEIETRLNESTRETEAMGDVVLAVEASTLTLQEKNAQLEARISQLEIELKLARGEGSGVSTLVVGYTPADLTAAQEARSEASSPVRTRGRFSRRVR